MRKLGLFLSIIALTYSAKCQSDNCTFIKTLDNYQSSIKFDWNQDCIYIVDSTFYLNDYLNIFDKLNLDPCFNAGMIYVCISSDAFPRIYAFPDSINIENFVKSQMDKSRTFYDSLIKVKTDDFYKCYNFFVARGIMHDIREHNSINYKETLFMLLQSDSLTKAYRYMVPENSKEGYFQYLIFYLMGERFGLSGHANYGFKRIVCSYSDLNEIIKNNKTTEDYNFDINEVKSLFDVDIEPKINIFENICTITLIEYTHSGFSRNTYTIDLSKKNTISKTLTELLVKNDFHFYY